ncbi:hypothetical protein B566_EDAN008641 [Ephemera danica]|nr:hypothetical protein B566_EDAN008641 [Ephemera danica]
MPTTRGAFDTFFGFLNGFVGYYDHEIIANLKKNVTAHDFWRNLEPQYKLRGRYVTDLLTEESAKKKPLFLFISHLAVHAGNPGGNDLEYPVDDLDRFSYIPDLRRRKLAAMVWNLDKSVGEVVKALADNNILSNSIIVFASDNGAQTVGTHRNDGSNYPFRGLKTSLFEGGVHTTAFIWSKDLHGKGGNMGELTGIDGRDQSENLLQESTGDLDKDEYAGREELLVNIEDKSGQRSVIYRNWKLVSGTIRHGAYDDWFGDYRNVNYEYQTTRVSQSPVSIALSSLPFSRLLDENMLNIRSQVQVSCDYTTTEVTCNPVEAACLFDLSTDPCERVNLNASRPDIVMQLTANLQFAVETTAKCTKRQHSLHLHCRQYLVPVARLEKISPPPA